ncbi:unannotated protein [freshwater metagenome]|uniref:Unannotated protein n=1 Tax=freshwater metagenome TaxID=449393 RepID=A0A6J7LIW7_9ZZZZ
MPDEASSESRATILRLIEESGTPLNVFDLTERTGLHANTVRGHLDVLLSTNVISRQPERATSRGRPRWLYGTAAAQPSPYQQLAEVLATELSRIGDDAATRVGDLWANLLPPLTAAQTPDEAVQEAAAALDQLGFSTSVNPAGDTITVTNCPYEALVADNPVICDIHASLVARVLAQIGQPVTLDSMDVWARPGLCQAHLLRSDLIPTRTIRAADLDPEGKHS